MAEKTRDIAAIAADIATAKEEVRNLQRAAQRARSESTDAEVRLANLQIELTRAVAGDLDLSTLDMDPRVMDRRHKTRMVETP